MNIAFSLEDMHLGGGPKFVLNLGRGLVQAGHSVTVVTQRRGEWWREITSTGMHGYSQPQPSLASVMGQARRLARFWNQGSFDVIFVNIGGLNHRAQAALHLVDDKTAIVPILHGDWRELYRISASLAPVWNVAVGVSPAVHHAAAAYMPDKPVIGIANGIDIPSDAVMNTRSDWQSPLRLLFTGRMIDAHKGILRLPKILAACRARGLPVHLTVVGDGPDRAALENEFAAHRLQDMVTMHGALTPAATISLMLEHHVLLLPSNTEGLPLVMLEAMAAGCPVIASHLHGITDAAIEDGVSGRLTAPNDIERWTSHIADMLDPDVWRSHSRAAAARARTRFSSAVMTQAYLDLLDGIARGEFSLAQPRRSFVHRFSLRDRLPLSLLPFLPIGVGAHLRRSLNSRRLV
jgi:glycosyltransferase involved in cell wall biosynthesis